jgi:hypothetical protein
VELAQEVGDVAMHRVLAQYQPLGDLSVRQPPSELFQHLVLACGDLRQPCAIAAAPDRAVEQPARPLGLGVGRELDQAIPRSDRLALGLIDATQRSQARGKLDAHLAGLEGCPASLEAVQGVLQKRPGPLVLPAGGRQDPFGQIRAGT